MKIAKRDLALIMVIVGIIAAFCAYKFSFSSTLEQIDDEKSAQESLEAQIADFQRQEKEIDKNKIEDQEKVKEINKAVEKYKATYRYEDGILWMKGIEDNIPGTVVDSYTVGEIGSTAIFDEKGQMIQVGGILYDATVTGEGDFKGKIYLSGVTNYTFHYNVADYESLKTFIDYIAVSGTNGVKTIQSMNIEPSGEGFQGNVTMNVHILADEKSEYTMPNLDDVPQGVPQIFPIVTPEPEKKPENKPVDQPEEPTE